MMQLFHSQTKPKEVFNSSHLANYLPKSSKRYQHTLGVVRAMKNLLPHLSIPADWKPLLIQASYLHDIGYSSKLFQYEFHPLDGAIFAAQQNFPKPVVAAVLFHTCAFELAKEGMHPQIKFFYLKHLPLLDSQDRQFIDWVTYCDLHTSPTGEKVTLQERLDEILHRYGPQHRVSQIMHKNKGDYEELIDRVHQFAKISLRE